MKGDLSPQQKLWRAISGENPRDYRGMLSEVYAHLYPGATDEKARAEWITRLLEDHRAAETKALCQPLADALATLDTREQTVLRLRFGLENGHSRTLRDVGQEFGVTPERIRQIETKALRKLRHPSRARHLKDLVPCAWLREQVFQEFKKVAEPPALWFFWWEDREAMARQMEQDREAMARQMEQLSRRISALETENKCLREVGGVTLPNDLSLDTAGLSRQVVHALARANIQTVGEAMLVTDAKLLLIRRFGPARLKELRTRLRELQDKSTEEKRPY